MEPWKERVYASYTGLAVDSGPEQRQARWARERRQYIRRFRRFLPPDAHAPILEIGCGSGTFLDALRFLGYSRVEGIDVSPGQVAAAHARGVSSVTLAAATEYLRARPAAYAAIAAFNVLEHQTRGELFELLDAVVAALMPGGCLIAVVPNAKGLFGAHVRFGDITHELSFTPSSVHQVCGVAGLECTTIVEQGPVVHGVVSALRWVVWQSIRGALLVARVAEGGDWRWPVFTQDLAFVARKPTAA